MKVVSCFATLSLVCGAAHQPASPVEDGVKDDEYIVQTFRGDSSFLWGAATASAQIEGAWNISKQTSIWDDFCHNITAQTGDTTLPFSKQCGDIPRGVEDKELWTTLDVTDDFYHQYHSDLSLVRGYGMNAMRVSISWPRLRPLDTASGAHKLNPEGVQFYKNVFKSMMDDGITPFVTLFHWDLPNDLSWLNETVVQEFEAFAKDAFAAFPEITNWATFNEPTSVCSHGYATGGKAPGHKSTTDHLLCGHNVLKSHARAVAAYRESAAPGQIGIILDYKWAYPQDPNSDKDVQAAAWDRDNVIGFWADPIFKGDYPQSLRDFFGQKLPTFTDMEKNMLLGSADFWGLNTYGGKIAVYNDLTLDNYTAGVDIVERYSFCPCDAGENKSAVLDEDFECGAASPWLWAKPDAIRQYLNYVTQHYKVPKIYVTEFGVDVAGESDMPKEVALKDEYRQEYYQRYLYQIALAKAEDKNPIAGVFAWSLLDNFEWGDGLNFRFGITYVDFKDKKLTRTPKQSAGWWTQIIRNSTAAPAPVMV